MREERTIYRERTGWSGLAHAIIWGTVVLCTYPLLAGWHTDLPLRTRLPMAASIPSVMGAIYVLFGGLTVHLRESSILLHVGMMPIIRKRVQLSQIEGVGSVTYRPIRDFGGWGIRGVGKRKIWSARGNRAVVLELSGGRTLLIGSDRPRRLELRIRAALPRS